jgi:eukaryotic-like serine/threonine-protein kinase
MTLNAGDKLGPYEVLSLIGAGGMGEVYKARDTRLGRIKVAKADFTQRFEREARAVAALNHPNICALSIRSSSRRRCQHRTASR